MNKEAALFKVLADSTRLRIAILLAVKGETCVCLLADGLDLPEYKISRHLGIMRSAGLVEVRRKGTWMYYKLSKARSRLEKCLQECFRDCLVDIPTMKADMKRLSKATCKMANKQACCQ